MSTGTISDASLSYMKEKHIESLLDEAFRDVLLQMPDDPLLFLENAFQRRTPMRLIVVGPPGSEKRAQCERVASTYGLEHILADEKVSDAVDGEVSGPAASGAAHELNGEAAVSDEALMNEVVHKIQRAEKEGKGWVLDGSPRTRAQAIYLQTSGIAPQRFLHLDVPLSVAIDRMHQHSSDPRGASAVKTQFDYFDARKNELVDCYRPFYVRIDASRGDDEVFREITAQCDALGIAE